MNENKNIYKVYKYTNLINGKIYIGQTMESIEMRAGHNGYKYRKCPYFYNAIKKYGWDNFTVEILQDNLTHEQANEFEVNYIKLFNSQDPNIGYNISDGGNTNSVLRKKIYQYSLDGEYIREWESLSDARRFYGQGITSIECGRMRSAGYQWSYEKVDKMPPNHNLNTGTSKKVYQYSLDGDFIAEYSSMSEAARVNGANDPKHISQCCNNKRRSALGFRWSFILADKLPNDDKIKRIVKHKIVKINPITNEIIELFDSPSEAAKTVQDRTKSKSQKLTDIGKHITHCCRKGLKYTCYGYKWKFADDI
jgi:group I intron endonuclease